MANNTVSSAANPTLVNQLAEQATSEKSTAIAAAEITTPSDTLVNLPGGYISPTGEVITTAEVRELTGRDEEAFGKVSNPGRLFYVMANRATVSLGNHQVTDDIMDTLLAGDRDALLLGIYKATFGPTAELAAWCEGCKEFKDVTVNINEDIKTSTLSDPKNDRTFTVKGRKDEYLVTLPTGFTQKEIIAADEKNSAEITTILLQSCVLEVNGQSVYSPIQIQRLGVADRRLLLTEIGKRNVGPKFEAINITCPDCNGEVSVPINLGSLFPF